MHCIQLHAFFKKHSYKWSFIWSDLDVLLILVFCPAEKVSCYYLRTGDCAIINPSHAAAKRSLHISRKKRHLASIVIWIKVNRLPFLKSAWIYRYYEFQSYRCKYVHRIQTAEVQTLRFIETALSFIVGCSSLLYCLPSCESLIVNRISNTLHHLYVDPTCQTLVQAYINYPLCRFEDEFYTVSTVSPYYYTGRVYIHTPYVKNVMKRCSVFVIQFITALSFH
jgi:hypothetical protein